MSDKNSNPLYDIMQGITQLFLFFMIVCFPLYYQNNYLNISLAKKNFFQIAAGIFIFFGIVIGIPAVFEKRKTDKKIRVSRTDCFALLFLCVLIISCIISPEQSEAFLGNEGRKLGGLFLLLCIIVYFIISRFYRTSQIVLWGFLLTNISMWILVILNFFGIDMLHMYDNLVSYEHKYFIGTMGNINVNAAYFGVTISIMMAFYYNSRENLSKGCFFWAVMIGICACFATRSESWILALAGAYFVLLYFAMNERKQLKKWWKLCLAFFLSSVIVAVVEKADYILGWQQIRMQGLREDKILYTLLEEKVLLAEGILLLLFFIVLKSKYISIVEKYGRKILMIVLLITIVILVAGIFPMEDSFGSNRGYIWKRSVLNFKEFPIWQKLFGYGPNCFLQSMEERYGAEMRALYGNPFADAHNEFLQFLTVTGILGMIAYFGMQLSLVIHCILKKEENPSGIVGCVGIIAYMMQAMVNNPQVFTMPLLFIFLGIVENKLRRCE